jgi:hypothetical protein
MHMVLVEKPDGMRPLARTIRVCGLLKLVFASTERRGLYSCGSGKSPTVVGFCEHDNELSSCITRSQFLD